MSRVSKHICLLCCSLRRNLFHDRSRSGVYAISLGVSLFVLSWVAPIPTSWGEERGVTAQITAYKITRDQKGIEQREAADSASPGDVIEYGVVYTNIGISGVRNLAGKLPIPVETTYLADTAEPKKIQASLDGLKFDAVPLTRIVKLPDGTERTEPVPYSEYRVLQWELGDLLAGEEKQVKARVRLNTDTPKEVTGEKKDSGHSR